MTRAIALRLLIASALAACSSAPTERSTQLLGRWEKIERSLPAVTLELRRENGATVGQVWLSGVTYTLPATLDDTLVVLARPESSALAPFVGRLEKDGRLRVVLRGPPDHEEYLVRMP